MTSGAKVWQQADAASIDIVSIEHDTHDQDIADAIARALGAARATHDQEIVDAVVQLIGDIPASIFAHPVASAIDVVHSARRDPLRFIQPIS